MTNKHKMKMWIVKREVLATSLEKAAISKGRIFSVEEAKDKYQPEVKKKPAGFVPK